MAGKGWRGGSVIGHVEVSAPPLKARHSECSARALETGPAAGLIARALPVAALAGTIGRSAGGRVVGLTSRRQAADVVPR
jgi:hypothetical protein